MAVPHGLLVAKHAGEIIDRVHEGEIGELKLVSIECDKWDIINAGIHWLNFFVVLTKGEQVRYVIAQCDDSTRTFRNGMQVETLGVTYAQTSGGTRLVMNTGDYVDTSHAGKGTVFRLVGTKGLLEFWAWENSYYLLNADHPEGKIFNPDQSSKPNHQLHLEALAAQIDADRPSYEHAESSLTALELVEAAYLSDRCGCRVDLPLADFEPPAATDWEPGRPYSGSGGGRNGRELR